MFVNKLLFLKISIENTVNYYFLHFYITFFLKKNMSSYYLNALTAELKLFYINFEERTHKYEHYIIHVRKGQTTELRLILSNFHHNTSSSDQRILVHRYLVRQSWPSHPGQCCSFLQTLCLRSGCDMRRCQGCICHYRLN